MTVNPLYNKIFFELLLMPSDGSQSSGSTNAADQPDADMSPFVYEDPAADYPAGTETPTKSDIPAEEPASAENPAGADEPGNQESEGSMMTGF